MFTGSTLLRELTAVRSAMLRVEGEQEADLRLVAPPYRDGARNLLHFIAFHSTVHPGLAQALRDRGLCSLQGCDAHLLASVNAVIEALCRLEQLPPIATVPVRPPAPDRRKAWQLLESHCVGLFGPPGPAAAPTIMVTLPRQAAEHSTLVRELLEAGMTMARINCAHDDAGVWCACVARLREARQATGRDCRIAMDLAGPKLRTGPLPPLPGRVRIRPRRDRFGRLLEAGRVRAVASGSLPRGTDAAEEDDLPSLPTLAGEWGDLDAGDRLHGTDASGRRRMLRVIARDGQGLLLSCEQSCHFTSGLIFEPAKPAVAGRARRRGRLVVADLPEEPGVLRLRVGDDLLLSVSPTAAADAGPCAIPCTLPEVFADVKVGERVLFDDGRIGAVIRSRSPEGLHLEITAARAKGAALRADKGINFPDSHLHTPALTARDIEDLAVAADHADIVSYSFVHRVADIEALHQALACRGREDLAVVLKIETRRAFLNLPRLLLAAMRWPAPIGVMIARGDLAIECGWESLAEIQEEILSICAAAHVPCIWATQVLDEMARHGTPTRAEITDAAMGGRAGALMLNKGPNIPATIRILRRILEQVRGEPLVSCLAFRTRLFTPAEGTPSSGGG